MLQVMLLCFHCFEYILIFSLSFCSADSLTLNDNRLTGLIPTEIGLATQLSELFVICLLATIMFVLFLVVSNIFLVITFHRDIMV
jgi:hypothetical protein